jgi:hypothetical protein
MRWNVQEWVERVNAKPKHIRERYVFGCVAVGMFFILVIWSLSVSETFREQAAVARERGGAAGILPKASTFSLDQFLNGETTLRGEPLKTGDQFLREEIDNRTRPDFDETGVVPKETSDTPATSR